MFIKGLSYFLCIHIVIIICLSINECVHIYHSPFSFINLFATVLFCYLSIYLCVYILIGLYTRFVKLIVV